MMRVAGSRGGLPDSRIPCAETSIRVSGHDGADGIAACGVEQAGREGQFAE